MEFPHRLYLKFLVSRKMTPYEVRAECVARGLMPPQDDDLHGILNELGPFPKSWKPRIDQSNVPFRRWLRDVGVGMLWNQDDDTKAAMDLVHRGALRRDFEQIILAHGDVKKARRELAVKYPESMVPTATALQRYYDIFWDIGSMSSEGLFNYLEADLDREGYKEHLRGDLLHTYAQLGLQQQIANEVLLQQMVMMGYAAAVRATREMNTLGGPALAALAATAVAGANAGDLLRQVHVTTDGDTSLRKEAADFMTRVVQAPRIPSIDELDVIDAEEVENGSNVRRLPSRG
jgi:hypothetical protein